MDPDFMKYKIESDLKNYEKALEMIAKSGNKFFEESLALIKKQRLFKQALVLYKDQPELHAQVKTAFGDYLLQRGYVQEAGLLYMGSENPSDLQKSLEAFKKCANVEMAFSVAYKLKFTNEQQQQLLQEMVEILAAASKFVEAAELYCKQEAYSSSQAVEYFNKGGAFLKAIKEAMKEGDLSTQ